MATPTIPHGPNDEEKTPLGSTTVLTTAETGNKPGQCDQENGFIFPFQSQADYHGQTTNRSEQLYDVYPTICKASSSLLFTGYPMADDK
jgi:hypothetical protein